MRPFLSYSRGRIEANFNTVSLHIWLSPMSKYDDDIMSLKWARARWITLKTLGLFEPAMWCDFGRRIACCCISFSLIIFTNMMGLQVLRYYVWQMLRHCLTSYERSARPFSHRRWRWLRWHTWDVSRERLSLLPVSRSRWRVARRQTCRKIQLWLNLMSANYCWSRLLKEIFQVAAALDYWKTAWSRLFQRQLRVYSRSWCL